MKIAHMVLVAGLQVVTAPAIALAEGSSFEHARSKWEYQRNYTLKNWESIRVSSRRYQVERYKNVKAVIDYESGVIHIVANSETPEEAIRDLDDAIRNSIATNEVWEDVVDSVGQPAYTPEKIAEATPAEKIASAHSSVLSKTLVLVSDHRQKRAGKHSDLIRRYAQLQGLRPQLVTAVIDAESYFNPKARSKAGAVGLMQLVPTTGGRDAMRLSGRGDRNPTDGELLSPEINIDLGTTYLGHLLNRYSYVKDTRARELLALAAYNWGMGNVDTEVRPASTITSQQVIYRLNTAPKETRNYIARIRKREKEYASL